MDLNILRTKNDINCCMVIGQPIAGRDTKNINYSNAYTHVSVFIADKVYRIIFCDDIIEAYTTVSIFSIVKMAFFSLLKLSVHNNMSNDASKKKLYGFNGMIQLLFVNIA